MGRGSQLAHLTYNHLISLPKIQLYLQILIYGFKHNLVNGHEQEQENNSMQYGNIHEILIDGVLTPRDMRLW